MKKSKKPLYKIGDLVACYISIIGNGKPRRVIGWVEHISYTTQSGNIYYIRWSDSLEDDLTFVRETEMLPLIKLVEQIRNNDVS